MERGSGEKRLKQRNINVLKALSMGKSRDDASVFGAVWHLQAESALDGGTAALWGSGVVCRV